MESWDFDPPGVDVLEWAFNYLSDNKLIDSKQIETGFPKNRLIDDGEDRKHVYLSGTVCDDVNLILRNGDIISELREEVQFGKYDVTIIGKSRKRNMSHDLLQYINSSVLIVNNYDNEKFNKIVNKAGKDKIIVMKASSMSPIQRFFKGSIPLSVMNECDVPILIVK